MQYDDLPPKETHREIRYYSFDVFDTCVTRYCINPPDLFESLFTRLLSQVSAEKSSRTSSRKTAGVKQAALAIETAAKALARSRIQAEQAARSQVASDDVALAKIYQTFAPSLQAYNIDPADALAEEIELELAAVSPILSIRQKIQTLRAQGHVVIFISDMYLPGSVVRQMLIEHGFTDGSDGVYVSADIGFSKGSGRLFTYVCNQLGISPKQLHHTGDNAYADIRAAQQLGIHTTYFTQGNPTRYEQGFRSELIGNDWMRSYLIGLSRAVRLRHDSGISDTHQHATIAADVLAPLLTSYVIWVLTTAQQTGIQSLHFTEEGLLAVANTIIHQWQQQKATYPTAHSLPKCYGVGSASARPAATCQHKQALVGFDGGDTTQSYRYGHVFSLLSSADPAPMGTTPMPGHLNPIGSQQLAYLEAPISPSKRPEGTAYLFEYRSILRRFLQVVSTATLPIYRDTLLDYATNIAWWHSLAKTGLSLGEPASDKKLYAMLKRYATRNAIGLLSHPTIADVQAFSALQLAADAPPVSLMAKPVRLLALPAFSKQFLKGSTKNRAQNTAGRWLEGSVAMSPWLIRFILTNLRGIYQKLTQYLAPQRGKKMF